MITAENVKELAIRFWAIVGSGSDGHEAAGMFLTGGLLLPDGAWVSIAEHQAMHRPLCDESHEWLSLSVTPLCEDPQRVLARGTVRWGATVTRTGHRLMADGIPQTTPTEFLICLLARTIGQAASVAAGAASPIPGSAALLAQAQSRGRTKAMLLGSTTHGPFNDGGPELFDRAAQGDNECKGAPREQFVPTRDQSVHSRDVVKPGQHEQAHSHAQDSGFCAASRP